MTTTTASQCDCCLTAVSDGYGDECDVQLAVVTITFPPSGYEDERTLNLCGDCLDAIEEDAD